VKCECRLRRVNSAHLVASAQKPILVTYGHAESALTDPEEPALGERSLNGRGSCISIVREYRHDAMDAHLRRVLRRVVHNSRDGGR
jgi:hypothetical protein